MDCTLIELFDERPIENVLATEVFAPPRTVFLCPPSVARDAALQEKLRRYFSHCGVKTKLVFREAAMFDSKTLLNQLRDVIREYGDCCIDITGGTDDALFASGMLAAETKVPAFTYSRRTNCFYNIQNAPFLDGLPCNVEHDVEECFLMAGGALRMGRVDNNVLSQYLDRFDPFFAIYLKYRADWTKIVKYFVVTSQHEEGLTVNADTTVHGERNQRITMPENCMRELKRIGFLKAFEIQNGRVRYTFADRQIRAWLRDIGSVLELYVYKACLDSGLFGDVRSSAVVDWEGDLRSDNVTNEIDVMAMRGTLPVFISCKTSAIATEALNELAILRDRFGGYGAKAVIVSSQAVRSVTRHRAEELSISVIDLNDLKNNRLGSRIASIVNSTR